LLLWHQLDERRKVLEALRELGKEEMAGILFADRGSERERLRQQTSRKPEKRGTSPRTKRQDRRKQF